jgi:hypothetical protein
LIDSWPLIRYPFAHPVHASAEAMRETFENTFFSLDDRTAIPVEKGFVEVSYV